MAGRSDDFALALALRRYYHFALEALARAALLKFESDSATPPEAKVHEICQLLIHSPAGVPPEKGGKKSKK